VGCDSNDSKNGHALTLKHTKGARKHPAGIGEYLNSERALQPSAPAVLPENPNHVEIGPSAGVYASAGVKLDRIVPVYGQRKCGSHSRILL
jgi:hypothetical protein